MIFNQYGFEIRCEWGEKGVSQLTPISNVVIIVDVMSFSTCVDIAVSNGAIVFPYRFSDSSARDFANSIGAEFAGKRGESKYSLSPRSLMEIPKHTRIVLPSPNGASLTLSAEKAIVLAGCLRNCRTVAEAAMKYGRRISVIPAGERWKDDWSLRPAFEDLVAAGAIISHISGKLSPEARAAVAVYNNSVHDIRRLLKNCASGIELIDRGFEDDIDIISEIDMSNSAPIFREGAYIQDTGI